MRNFTILCLSLALLFGVVGGVEAEKMDLTFEAEGYCTASWNSETRIFSWGSGGVGNPDWTFINTTNVSGDRSNDLQQLY